MKMEKEGLIMHYTGLPADFDALLEKLKYVRTHISDRGKWELLAEEAAELSQAALKMCRLLGDDVGDTYPVNPDKYNVETCSDNLAEELVDVLICIDLIYSWIDVSRYADKVDGMYERIKTCEEELGENEEDVFPNMIDRSYKVSVDSRCKAANLLLSLKAEAAKNGGFVTIDDLNVLTGKNSLIYDTQCGWTEEMLKNGGRTEFDTDYHSFLVLPQPIFRNYPFENN